MSIEEYYPKRDEFLAWCFEDFTRFAGILQIIPKMGPRTPLILNDIQKEFSKNRTGRDVVLKGRQMGMSTVEVARDIFYLLTHPGSRVMVVVQSIENHKPLKTITKMAEVMFESLRDYGVGFDLKHTRTDEWEVVGYDSTLSVIEAGASEASANKKGRSGTVNRLHLTEIAFWEYAQNTVGALMQCVPAAEFGGEVVVESTPNGASGVFHNMVVNSMAGKNEFKFHLLEWWRDPTYSLKLDPGETITPQNIREEWLVLTRGVSQEQLKWWRRMVCNNGIMWVEQEYPSDPFTCFLASGRSFFDKETLQKMQLLVRPPEKVLCGGKYRSWQGPKGGAEYVIGVDTSEGTGGDAGAAMVFERGSGRHVGTLHGQFRPWDLAREISKLGQLYNMAHIAVERAQHGHAVIQCLDTEHHYPAIWRDRDGKYGWLNVQQTRTAILDRMEDATRKEVFKTPDDKLLGEMSTFIVTDTGKAEAASGEHDDLVLAAAIGWEVISRAKSTRFDYGSGY